MNFVLPDEERFAEFLRTALQEVHTPVPTPPREEMWASIMEQRQGGRGLAAASRTANVSAPVVSPTMAGSTAAMVSPRGFSRVEAGSASVIATTTPTTGASKSAKLNTQSILRRYGIPMRWALPIAAAVLIVGVGVGWQFEHARTEHAAVAEAPTRIPRELSTQVAVDQYLKEVEHLVAYFENPSSAAAANNAITEAQVAAWARDLLATTQLLIDSHLGMDPQLRKLLTDVEMVLVQISQANSTPTDWEITEQSIEQSQMRERLQNATPVTPQSQKTPAKSSEAL